MTKGLDMSYQVQDRKDTYSAWRTVLENIAHEDEAIRASELHYQQQIFTEGTEKGIWGCQCEPCREGYRAGLNTKDWKSYEVRYIPITN